MHTSSLDNPSDAGYFELLPGVSHVTCIAFRLFFKPRGWTSRFLFKIGGSDDRLQV
jgi:hypothetical protein